MYQFSNTGRMCQTVEDLPKLSGRIFMDFETSSGDPKETALDPWRNCHLLEAIIATEDSPVFCADVRLIERHAIHAWLQDIASNCTEWVNHNVKYDAHVLKNSCGIEPPRRMFCTVVHAKLLDSDRQYTGGYGLDALSKSWLKEDIGGYEDALKPYLYRNKDYGAIPPDILGEYGCQDVFTERRLWKYEESRCEDDMRTVWETETELTYILYKMEQRGVCVDPRELQIKELLILDEMLRLEAELAELVGFQFRPHTNEDCFQVLCNTYGLPVLGWTEQGEPSFDKSALTQYVSHPYAPKDVVLKIRRYRHLNTLNSLFVTKFQRLHQDGVIHSSYNQVLRTGRMSCKNPNSQQNSKEAKSLFHPRPGHAFLSFDYSQIEFRTIVHYIQDEDAIAAYNANPDTDFHQWVADECHISRKPAKTVNFMMGFGGGKDKTVSTLSNVMDLVADVNSEIDKLVESSKIQESQRMDVFHLLCRKRAEQIYATYHNNLPTLKTTSRRCARVCQARGYVRNWHGRRRHIPANRAHIAFNAINQGEAADIMKERMVALAAKLEELGLADVVFMIACVHDELLLEGPVEILCDLRFIKCVVDVMEKLAKPLRVPVRGSVGISTKSWRDASDDGCTGPIKLNWVPESSSGGLSWVRSTG